MYFFLENALVREELYRISVEQKLGEQPTSVGIVSGSSPLQLWM